MMSALRSFGFPLAVALLSPVVAAAESTATLVIERVEVRTTKDDGKTSWDAGGGAPDIKVTVERVSEPKGETHATSTEEDKFKATFNRKALGVDEGDRIEIRVLDEDVAADDRIGGIEHKITAKDLKSGEIELAFDQVDKLILRLER
jgi:hypothetical protein